MGLESLYRRGYAASQRYRLSMFMFKAWLLDLIWKFVSHLDEIRNLSFA